MSQPHEPPVTRGPDWGSGTWEYGFSPDYPVFDLMPAVPLTYEELFARFASCVREQPASVHFAVAPEGLRDPYWELVLIPEGLQVVDSPAYCAMRGAKWHNDDSMWVITGYAQLCWNRHVQRVGRARIKTNERAWFGGELEHDRDSIDPGYILTGQLLPLGPTAAEAAQPELRHIDHIEQLLET